MTAPPAPEYIHLVLVMCSSVLALGTVKSPYLHPVEVLEQLLVGDPLLLVFSVDRSLLSLKATHGSGWGGEQSPARSSIFHLVHLVCRVLSSGFHTMPSNFYFSSTKKVQRKH